MPNLFFSRKRVVVILLIIILAGTFLRLYNLGEEGLWIDEAFSVHHAQEDLVLLSENVARTEGAPLGYYVGLHYWISRFGSSEFSVRFPSLIFGVFSILIIFKLTRLFFKRDVALLSSFFLATSMLQVLYSQEARLYSLFTFLALLSTYSFFKWYLAEKDGDKNKYYSTLYTLSIFAAIYTNYLTTFLVLLYTFVILITWKVSRKLFWKWIFMHIIILVMALPLLPSLLNQFVIFHVALPKSLMAKGLPAFLANTGIFFFTLPFVAILFVLFVAYLFRSKTEKMFLNLHINDQIFTLFVLLFSLAYIYLVKYKLSVFGINLIPRAITHSYFLTRHPFFLVSVIYVFLACKIVNMKSKKLTAFCLLLIIVVNSFSLMTYYETTTKAEWKETMSYLESRSVNPLVLVDRGGFSNVYLLEYYSKEPMEIVRLTWANRTLEGRKLKRIDPDVLSGVLRDDFWLILARGSDDYYKNYFENHNLIEEKEFYEINLYHYGSRG